MGRKIVPERMPKEVVYVAVEAEDLVNVSESLSPKVEAALPEIVERVKKELA
jgi:hydrogenase maturation protease